jgi:calcineurin-like phosphoesterase family protein
MKIFLTSDTYFGRKLTALERGFNSSEEMDDVIIQNWNKRVGPKDVVIHLGNFGWDPISSEGAMAFLEGNIKFIPATHDTHMPEVSLFRMGRHQILINSITKFPEHNLIVSPWPLMDWYGKSEGVIHAHGGTIKTDVENGYRFNVNIGNWNLAPIELDFIKEMIELQD